jgi:hypothetical protein
VQKPLCVAILLLAAAGCDACPSRLQLETTAPDVALRSDLSVLGMDARRQRVDRFRTSLSTRLNRSGDGLSHRQLRPGVVATPLEGRFGKAMLARRGADGQVEYGCFDDANAAARFLDPKAAGESR